MSNLRLENWTELDIDKNWTERKTDSDPPDSEIWIRRTKFGLYGEINPRPETGLKVGQNTMSTGRDFDFLKTEIQVLFHDSTVALFVLFRFFMVESPEGLCFK